MPCWRAASITSSSGSRSTVSALSLGVPFATMIRGMPSTARPMRRQRHVTYEMTVIQNAKLDFGHGLRPFDHGDGARPSRLQRRLDPPSFVTCRSSPAGGSNSHTTSVAVLCSADGVG
ncbi:hypothetical protein BH24ACT6_BH24ACT6_01680 [soil metagenome]